MNNNRIAWQAETYGLSEAEVLHRGCRSAAVLQTLLAKNKENIYVRLKGRDYYRRHLGTLFIIQQNQMININRYMLEFGGCVPYRPKPRGGKAKNNP